MDKGILYNCSFISCYFFPSLQRVTYRLCPSDVVSPNLVTDKAPQIAAPLNWSQFSPDNSVCLLDRSIVIIESIRVVSIRQINSCHVCLCWTTTYNSPSDERDTPPVQDWLDRKLVGAEHCNCSHTLVGIALVFWCRRLPPVFIDTTVQNWFLIITRYYFINLMNWRCSLTRLIKNEEYAYSWPY